MCKRYIRRLQGGVILTCLLPGHPPRPCSRLRLGCMNGAWRVPPRRGDAGDAAVPRWAIKAPVRSRLTCRRDSSGSIPQHLLLRIPCFREPRSDHVGESVPRNGGGGACAEVCCDQIMHALRAGVLAEQERGAARADGFCGPSPQQWPPCVRQLGVNRPV